MKIVRFLVLCFYMLLVIPMGAIMMGSLIYGGVVETIKTIKKS